MLLLVRVGFCFTLGVIVTKGTCCSQAVSSDLESAFRSVRPLEGIIAPLSTVNAKTWRQIRWCRSPNERGANYLVLKNHTACRHIVLTYHY